MPSSRAHAVRPYDPSPTSTVAVMTRMDHPMTATTLQRAEPTASPSIIGLLEFTLEVADLAAAERWGDDRPALWLAIGKEAFLGLWAREAGGEKAIHHGRGGAHVHFALRVPVGTLDAMQARLEALGCAVEAGWDFGNGNRAIYLDDPDGNVVEITERRTLWDGSPAIE